MRFRNQHLLLGEFVALSGLTTFLSAQVSPQLSFFNDPLKYSPLSLNFSNVQRPKNSLFDLNYQKYRLTLTPSNYSSLQGIQYSSINSLQKPSLQPDNPSKFKNYSDIFTQKNESNFSETPYLNNMALRSESDQILDGKVLVPLDFISSRFSRLPFVMGGESTPKNEIIFYLGIQLFEKKR